jgi:hypothetical protein
LSGTYVSVEPFHLFRYLDEQAFRYNNRGPMNDEQRFTYVMRKVVGKRLTYKEPIGKADERPEEAFLDPSARSPEAEGLTFRFGPRRLGFAIDRLHSSSMRL